MYNTIIADNLNYAVDASNAGFLGDFEFYFCSILFPYPFSYSKSESERRGRREGKKGAFNPHSIPPSPFFFLCKFQFDLDPGIFGNRPAAFNMPFIGEYNFEIKVYPLYYF